MRIPWPDGTTPEEMRRHTEEWKQRFREEEEKRRAEFEATLARKDVRELAPLWHNAVGDAVVAHDGPTLRDLEELERVTFELAIAAEVARKPNRSMGNLRGVLREMINGSLSHDRSSFRFSQALTQLRANAAMEIDGLVLAHEAALRRGDRGPEAKSSHGSGAQTSSPPEATSPEPEQQQPTAAPPPEVAATARTRAKTETKEAARTRRPRKGEKSKAHNLQALLLAEQHEANGQDWSISSIAREMGVPRATLNGRAGKDGPYRCGSFMRFAKKHGKAGKLTYRSEMGDAADRNTEHPADVAATEENDGLK